jgi:transcriptional regulator with XRE-family HTH domain
MTKQEKTSFIGRTRLAKNLRLLRSRDGLSQEALADLVDLHRTYVGSIERLERNVSLDNVEKLATALKVDISELLSDSLPCAQKNAN